MRVLLVGLPDERARLRQRLNGLLTVAGEFATPDEAEASGIESDAILAAPPGRLKPAPTHDADEAMPEPLTPREIQVLELLAEGLANKAIAGRLAISDQTVKFHVASISGKLRAANRTDAVRRAVRLGLITL
jgi:DNA-binding NarL/FixJ family response regulator